jgi:hypothetical protein
VSELLITQLLIASTDSGVCPGAADPEPMAVVLRWESARLESQRLVVTLMA